MARCRGPARPRFGAALLVLAAFAATAKALGLEPLHTKRRTRHFINLTNGVEALEALRLRGIDPGFVRIQSSHCEANDFYGILKELDHNLLMHLATGSTCLIYDYGSRGTFWPAVAADAANGDTGAVRAVDEGADVFDDVFQVLDGDAGAFDGDADDGDASDDGDVSDGAAFDGAPDEGVKVPRAIWWGVEWSRYALQRLWKVPVPQSALPRLRGYGAQPLFDEQMRRLPKTLAKRLKYYRKFDPTTVDLRGVYYAAGTQHDGEYCRGGGPSTVRTRTRGDPDADRRPRGLMRTRGGLYGTVYGPCTDTVPPTVPSLYGLRTDFATDSALLGDDVAYGAMVEDWLASPPTDAFDDGAVPQVLPPGFREYRAADYCGVGRSALKKKKKPRDAAAGMLDGTT